ncbi:pseudaminic acid cytidylyltransferase [Sphingobacterium hungaricum]
MNITRNNLCIIPARGGSKRIPRKNIKSFLGNPIISYSIRAAINSNLFSEVMVSTDDSEIANIAKTCGASIPFIRSQNNSDDFATTLSVLKEVVLEYEKIDVFFDNVCCVYPTAPFVSALSLKESFDEFTDKDFDSLFSIQKYSFPIQRSLNFREKKVNFNWPEFTNTRSQDLEESYHDAGQFYWLKRSSINNSTLITENSGGYLVSELQSQDIDTELDWKLAEMKFSLMHD